MSRAVIYCRVSTKEQVQKDALSIQIKEARNAVEAKGWELVDEYIEMESATTREKRPEYLRLLSDMRKKDKFDIIVVKSLDRLNRCAKNWYLFSEELVANDKLLYLYMERVFYRTDDNLLSGIRAILAEQYSRDLSRKINQAHDFRQKNGTTVLITNNTYGYRKNPDKTVSVMEEEADIVREIYHLAAIGYGAYSIRRILTEKGVRNRNGNPLGESTIRRIIKNPLFKGTAVMNRQHFDFEKKKTIRNPETDWIIHEGMVPAIVSPSLWERANKMFLMRKVKSVKPAGKRERDLLRGRIYCGKCKKPYYKTVRKNGQGEKITEWKCSTYLQFGKGENGCQNIFLRQEGMEKLTEEMGNLLFVYKNKENFIKKIEKIFMEMFPREEEKMGIVFLNKIRKKEERLLELYLEETISKQEFSRKRQELSLEAEQIEKETGRCDGEKRNREEKVKKTAEILKSGDKILAALFCLMIKDVEIDGRRLVFHLDLPAINWLESEKGEIRVRNKRTMIDKEIEVDCERYFKNASYLKKKKI